MALSIDIVKVIVLLSLLLLTFLFGILPLLLVRFFIRRRSRSNSESSSHGRDSVSYKRSLSFLSCFAAGVFLATCLLDLLPSVRHNLVRVLFSVHIYTGFPVAEFVMVIGLFLILIVEQIVLTVKEVDSIPRTDNSSNVHQPLLSHSQDDMAESFHSENSLGGISDQPINDTAGQGERETAGRGQRTYYSHHVNDQSDWAQSSDSQVSQISSDSTQRERPSQDNFRLQTHSPLRAFILVCALALHSIFEGLTIGLQLNIVDVVSIFAALVLHKTILSFSLGMNLVQSRISSKSTIKSILIFSLASPVGIAIGIGITDLWNSVSSGLVHGILQGIASGTFLYIIFFEILPKEFNCARDRLLKVLSLIVGYSSVTGILFLSNDVKHPFCVINDENHL